MSRTAKLKAELEKVLECLEEVREQAVQKIEKDSGSFATIMMEQGTGLDCEFTVEAKATIIKLLARGDINRATIEEAEVQIALIKETISGLGENV